MLFTRCIYSQHPVNNIYYIFSQNLRQFYKLFKQNCLKKLKLYIQKFTQKNTTNNRKQKSFQIKIYN